MIAELSRQEAVKFFSQRFHYLLLGLVFAVTAARMLVTAFTPPESSLDVVTAPQLWAQGMELGLRFAVYVLLVVGAMGFSREFSLGTVKTLLVLPIRRRDWVLAKLLALVVLAWGLALALALAAAGLVALTLGWGDLVREGVVLYAAGDIWRNLAAATGLTLVQLLPVCALALVVGLHFTASGPAVGVTLLLAIVLEAVVGLADWGRYLFLYHLFRPVQLIEKLGKGLPFRWEQVVEPGLATSLVTFVVLALWAIRRLERMDISG